MSAANPLWGVPRIHGELLNSGLTSVTRTLKTTSTYLAGTSDGSEEHFARFERKRVAREKVSEKDAHGDAHGAAAQPAATKNVEIS
jgi:hypothetical protein